MTTGTSAQQMTLIESLRLAVPLHIDEISDHPVEWLLGESKRCAAVIAAHGDDLQFGGKHCAVAFNATARGLACAALIADGGATFAGLHWCRDPRCPGPDAHTTPKTPGRDRGPANQEGTT